MRVAIESANQPQVVALIAELDAFQDTLYPAEARYALDLASLTQPNVVFAVARASNEVAIGCGAIVINENYGEIKRMYVCPEFRGAGVAGKIIKTLESAAHLRGCRQLKLETGPYQPEARAFYGKHGYLRCSAFGAYPEHPLSVFMSKSLTIVSPSASAEA